MKTTTIATLCEGLPFFKRDGDTTDTNGHGNAVERASWPGGERYAFDFERCTKAKGWTQYDTRQDAWYFGVWVNLEQRQIFTYCEGDLSLVTCPDDDHLRAELADAARCYGDPPPAFATYSFPDDDGVVTRTEHYDRRPGVTA